MNIPEDTLRRALEELLETMYFCDPIPLGPGSLASSGPAATIRFSGLISGDLRIAATEEFARRLAAEFLAVQIDEVDFAQAESMIQELANVACGSALGAWMPGDAFHFSAPVRAKASPLDYSWPCRFADDEGNPVLGVEMVLSPQ